MRTVKSRIGFVAVVGVALASVGTTWAQSDELPRPLRERISHTHADTSLTSAAGAFDTEVKLTPSDPNQRSTSRVAISGDTAFVCGEFDSVFVYRRDKGGRDNWGEVAQITASP